jgi:hypothetical protein
MTPERAAALFAELMQTPTGELAHFARRHGLTGDPSPRDLEHARDLLQAVWVALQAAPGPHWERIADAWGAMIARHGKVDIAAAGPAPPPWVRPPPPPKPSLGDPAPPGRGSDPMHHGAGHGGYPGASPYGHAGGAYPPAGYGPPGYPATTPQAAGYPPQAAYPAGGYPPAGYPPHPGAPQPGYPPHQAAQAGYPPQAAQGGYPPVHAGGYPSHLAAQPHAAGYAPAPGASSPVGQAYAAGVPGSPSPAQPVQSSAALAAASSVVAYAALCARCAAFPDRVAATQLEYGIGSVLERCSIDEHWQDRFDEDPALHREWERLCALYLGQLVRPA